MGKGANQQSSMSLTKFMRSLLTPVCEKMPMRERR